MKRLVKALPALALAGLLGACSSTPPLQFYTLGPLAPPPAASAPASTGASLVVGPVSVPATIDRLLIVRLAGSRAEVAEHHRWAAPLKTEIARRVAADLARRSPYARSVAWPQSSLADPALSEEGRERMRSHCRLGEALLADAQSPEIALAATIARGHHERFNGAGYPDRLAGEDIPLACRIVAVIDCFDALTLKRPFREAYPIVTAAEMVMAGSGTEFDPAVIAAFRQSIEALFTQVCGLRTVMPSNPYDAKGLLIASIENDDPVIFLEPKRLYNGPFDGHHDRPVVPWSKHELGQVPEGYYRVPLTSAAVFRPGQAVTVLAYGTMVWVSECAARETGIDAEIIDLRSLWPLDLDTVITSVKKTGRCVVVHEATRTSGFGAELVALVQEHCFHHLEAPIERVTGWDTPYPHAQEWAYFPGPSRVGAALKRVMEV